MPLFVGLQQYHLTSVTVGMGAIPSHQSWVLNGPVSDQDPPYSAFVNQDRKEIAPVFAEIITKNYGLAKNSCERNMQNCMSNY